jgi:hypothetical protein
MAEQWLSIVEYARTFNVSDMTVRRRIKTGRLHAVLKEGKYYIPVPVNNGQLEKPATKEAAATFPPRTEPMKVVKSHTTPERTLPGYEQSKPAARPANPSYSQPAVQSRNVSTQTSHPNGATVDVEALVAMCDAAVRKFSQLEADLENKHRARIALLEEKLKTKDLEMNGLRQQLEDLQLLAQLLEKKPS